MANSAAGPIFTLPHSPEYDHVQTAPLYWLIVAPALVLLAVAVTHAAHPATAILPLLAAGVLLAAALSFRHLRVVDEGDQLAIRFGPLPAFRKRIPYADIKTAEPDRTTVVDGWGIHWVAGRGWTYNLWGFDCVRLTLTNGQTLRIGTDDPQDLATFLQSKLAVRG